MKKLKVMMMTLMMCLVSMSAWGVNYNFADATMDSLGTWGFTIHNIDEDTANFQIIKKLGIKSIYPKFGGEQYNMLQSPKIHTGNIKGLESKLEIICYGTTKLSNGVYENLSLMISEYEINDLYSHDKVDTVITRNFKDGDDNKFGISGSLYYKHIFSITLSNSINTKYYNKDVYIYILSEGVYSISSNIMYINQISLSNSYLSKNTTVDTKEVIEDSIYSNNGTIYNLQNTDKIFNLQGIDVTKLNGSLSPGGYIVKFDDKTKPSKPSIKILIIQKQL